MNGKDAPGPGSHRRQPARAPNGAAPTVASLEPITLAKWQWEGTVDVLREIVCVLDESGRVMRANRAVERWGLRTVSESVGRTVHELLHPGCPERRCTLSTAIDSAWRRLDGEPIEFDFRCKASGSVWNLSLRPVPPASCDRTLAGTAAALIVSDISELHRARSALERLNAGLESRVRARTRELADANCDLRNEIARRESAERAKRRTMEELARLSGKLISAQESERRRIAIELHDSIGQSLTGIQYSLERAIEMLRRPAAGEPLPVLQLALDGVRQAAGSIREIAMNLRPTVLDDMGASSAVAWSCRRFAEVYPNIRVVADLDAKDGDIPDRLGTVVFRSTEELLNNIAKHAQATEVHVNLRRKHQYLWLEVSDNGVGIPEGLRDATWPSGHGIRNLRERADLTGGRFFIDCGEQSGSVARMCWHLMGDETAEEEARS